MRTTSYRLLRGPWGIAVDLTADARLSPGPPAGAEHVAGRVWLDVAAVLNHPADDRSGWRITGDEAEWLRRGAALAAPAIEARFPGGHTTVTVRRVLFPQADFQPEGLAAALLRWAEEEFGLPAQSVDVAFDRAAGRYVYDW
ncbi:hypothetical protein ACFT5C_34660 [Streptomyces sp. NPDC057116]|uniref:hypothetical protein n=1 Tax=Streptomyces sp. NPDC057116 TaxID=3346023 RepID=UPI0036326DCC